MSFMFFLYLNVLKTFQHIIRYFPVILLFFCFTEVALSQEGFKLPNNKKKDKIAFKLVNNLVVVPVIVNGTELSFLLDTGVNSTILFGLAEKDSLEINNARPIKLRGLGEGGSVSALKSEGNKVTIGDAVDNDHTLYVVFDMSLNFSTRMGVPIHGIMGYDFFKSFIVKTNYISSRLLIYNPDFYKKKKCKSCEEFDLTFYNKKPYITIDVSSQTKSEKLTLLVDSGSSDALWLFDEVGIIKESPKNYFDDFLGLGLSGSIYGKRSKLEKVTFQQFYLENLNVAVPDKAAIENIQFFEDRDGSIGGDILKRFTVIIDYPAKKMILKKNSNYNDPFHYNMSGLTLEHGGMVVVKDIQKVRNQTLGTDQSFETNGAVKVPVNPVYSFFLTPSIIIAEVRENSPAAIAGLLKGDEILTVNGKPSYKYQLYELTNMFYSKEGRKITMEIEREEKIFTVIFNLEKVL